MATTRPRRALRPIAYKQMLDSDSECRSSTGSVSNLSDVDEREDPTLMDEREDISYKTEIIQLPTVSDVLATEALIRTQAAKIAAVDVEYQNAKRRLESIEAKRSAMMQEMFRCRAYLARIRALPQEVLGLIFSFYMDDPSHSPWTLMQITRAWRATALSTRGIWSKIMIASPAWQRKGASRTRAGREMCGNKQQLSIALQRAGNAALDITFSLTHPHGNRFRVYDKKAFHEMVGYLASSRKCLQVRHMQIEGTSGNYLHWPDRLRFPGLDTLSVTSHYCVAFAQKISCTSAKVTDVQLALPSSQTVTASGFGLDILLTYRTMVSLRLDGIGHLDELRRVLDNAPYITTLVLNRVGRWRTSPRNTFIRLPSLQSLIMSGGSKAWAIDAPLLTSVKLLEGSFIPSGPSGSNQFPLLSSMTVSSSTTCSSLDYSIAHLHFPPLEVLDLCFTGRNDILLGLTSHHELNPVIFRLRKATLSTAHLTAMIGRLDRLEELQLEGVSVKKEFFVFLASYRPRSDDSCEASMHCPLLVKLQVDLTGGSRKQSKGITVIARNAATARFKAGVVPRHWSIRLSEERGWFDLLPKGALPSV